MARKLSEKRHGKAIIAQTATRWIADFVAIGDCLDGIPIRIVLSAVCGDVLLPGRRLAHPDWMRARRLWASTVKALPIPIGLSRNQLLGKRSTSEANSWFRSGSIFERMARTKTPANIVGPQIRKRRSELDRRSCQLQGFDISRGTLYQIEAQLRCVTDDELLALARVLKVTTDSLFPQEKI
jgi:hypothetical protein